ncbi:MAG: choice-of-anchor J domain-containing protein, partial [Schleiferiaceae bacterium]|nr:choice-of-anchor J domain-containing protein [Schleiferiaceae bacterium]
MAGTSTNYTLSGLNPSFDYDMYLVANCGGTDGVSDTIGPINVVTPIAGPRGVNCITGQPGAVFYDGFESVGNWTGDIGTTSGEWNYNSGGTTSGSTGPSGAHSGNQYLYVETSGIGPYTATIVSPAIDLSTANDSAELSFWLHAYGATMGTLDVGVGTSPSGPFTTVFTQNGQLQSSESDPYQNVGVRLDSYVGQTIYLQFDYTSGSSFTGDIAIDELEVTSCQTCPFPSQLALDSISSDAALISWNGSGSNYQVNWGPAGFTQGSPSSNFDSTTTSSILVDSLSGNTSYDLYLRTDCSDSGDGFSGWVGPLNFVTECNPFSAPYFTDFDNSTLGEVPVCWSEYIVGDDAEIITDDDDPLSSPNHMFLDNDSQFSNDTVVAVSPRFSDMTAGDKRVRFWVRAEFSTNNVDLWVGTMGGPDDGASLNVLDTIVVQGNTNYFEVSVNLDSANGYNGTDQYVALVHDNSNSFDGILVDDFTYETKPSCQGPQSTQTGVSSVTATSANIFWGGGQGDTTKIVWGAPGFTPATGAIGTGFAAGTDTTFTITGLAAQTTYEFYLQDSCAASGAGIYIGPFSFTTACLPLTAPVTEDFENTTNWTSSTIDPCWSRSNASGHAWEINSGTTGSLNTGPAGDNTTGSGQYIYTETSSSSPSVTTLVTPLIDVSGLNVPYLKYFYHRYGSDMGDLDVEVND